MSATAASAAVVRAADAMSPRRLVAIAAAVVCAVAVFSLVAVPNDYTYIPAALAFAAGGAAIAWLAGAEDRRFLLGVFLAGMALRLVLGVAFYYISIGIGGDGTPASKDDASYYEWGSVLVEAWRDGSLQPPPRTLPGSTQHGYIYLNAGLFAGFGQHLLVPVAFNAMLGALIALPAYSVGRFLWSAAAGRWAAVVVAAGGHMAFFAALNMKDTLIALLAITGIAVALRSRERLTAGSAFALAACAAGLLALRPTTAGLFVAIVAVFVGLPALRRLREGFDPGLIGVQAPALDRAAEVTTAYAVAVAQNGDAEEDVRELITRRGEAAEAEGGRISDDDSFFSIIADAHGLRRVALLPLAVIYTIVQPFPPWPRFGEDWHFNVLIVANAMWLAVVPFAVFGFLHALRNQARNAAPLLLFVAVWLLAVAWTYYGIQSRYRVTLEPMAMALAGAGFVYWPNSRPLVVLWALAIALAALLYVALKHQLPVPVLGALAAAWVVALAVVVRRSWLRPLLGLAWLDAAPPRTGTEAPEPAT